MKRIFLFTLLSIVSLTLAQAQLKGLMKSAQDAAESLKNGGVSQDEVGRGLKEALDKGVGEAVDFLSATDGYYKSPYKILIPEDAQKVTNKLKAVPGWSNVEKDLEEKMNRAAEIAAAKAKPIFINAIKKMTFQDAMNILMGNDNAATTYLKDKTFQNLFGEFMPVIQASLDEVNAREYWRGAVNAYNKIPFVSKANPELDQYVTEKALDGMFGLVAKKEEDIRNNTSSRTSDLLKKVFAKQD